MFNKKYYFIFFVLFFLSPASLSQEPFTPIYWIKGTVEDPPGQTANGLKIYFQNDRAWDIIGETGASGKPNEFIINAGEAGVLLETNKTYQVYTERINGFGVGPINVTITGKGIEILSPAALTADGGLSSAATLSVPKTMAVAKQEASPKIKVWFGNRLYQKALVQKGQTMVVAKNPKIKVEVSVDQPYTLSTNADDYKINVDAGQVNSLSLSPKAQTLEKTQAFSLNYSMPDPLKSGSHTFNVTAKTSGDLGTPAFVSEVVSVEVAGGPIRLIGIPLTYPSPFSVKKHRNVTIQYGLSNDTDIDLTIIGADGTRVKKYFLLSGTEGGSAGINKVLWNGITDQGYEAGNAIYLGTIIAKEEGKLLGKFKLTIMN
ncbi:MAG: hypothetical protein ABIH50_03960 [bacterium]